MLSKTTSAVLLFTLIIAFVMSLHPSLLNKIMQQKLCLRSYNETVCQKSTKEGTFLALPHLSVAVNYWKRVIGLSSLVPSIFTNIVIASLMEATVKKENIGLYVSTLLAIQSLVYMIIAMVKTSQVEHILAGSLLTIFFGDIQGALLIAWVFIAAASDSNLTRTLIFVGIEAMIYTGTGAGKFVAEYVSKFVPMSYLFAGSFTLAVIAFMVIYMLLPTFEDVIIWKYSVAEKEYYLNGKKNIIYYLSHPIVAINNEYLAGIVLATFLTELARYMNLAILPQFIMDPPLQIPLETANIFVWGTITCQGFGAFVLTIILIKIMYASDTTLILMSLSGTALYMALLAFVSSQILLYASTCCLAGFIPIAMACLRSTATKEDGVINGHAILMLGLLGTLSMSCNAVLTYNANKLMYANQSIYRPFSYIIAGILQTVAFIVVASISWTFKKPIIEVPYHEIKEKEKSKVIVQPEEDEQTEEVKDAVEEKKPLLNK